MEYLLEKYKLSPKKVSQKVEHLLESDSKKWSTFPKSASKSDAPFEAGKISTKKVRQKVEHLSESDSKKWSTFSKSASKSDAPI